MTVNGYRMVFVICTMAIIAFLALIAGCANGVQQMTPEQLKQMNGLAACNYYRGMYGQAGLVILNAEDLRKGAVGSSEITIAPESGCSVTIKNTSSPAPKPASAP